MTKRWETWEMFLDLEVFVNSLVWQSLVLGLVGLHLRNEIDKVLWLFEKFKFFCVNEVSKLIFNLDNELNHIETVKTVISEIAVEGDLSLFSGSEVALNQG